MCGKGTKRYRLSSAIPFMIALTSLLLSTVCNATSNSDGDNGGVWLPTPAPKKGMKNYKRYKMPSPPSSC